MRSSYLAFRRGVQKPAEFSRHILLCSPRIYFGTIHALAHYQLLNHCRASLKEQQILKSVSNTSLPHLQKLMQRLLNQRSSSTSPKHSPQPRVVPLLRDIWPERVLALPVLLQVGVLL